MTAAWISLTSMPLSSSSWRHRLAEVSERLNHPATQEVVALTFCTGARARAHRSSFMLLNSSRVMDER